jgi:hypothetical protein
MEEITSLKKFVKAYQKSEVIFDENSLENEMYLIHSLFILSSAF